MTSIEKRKSRLVFATSDEVKERGKYRKVVIEAGTHVATIRLLGMRQSFHISYSTIYETAAKIAVEQSLTEEQRERRNRRLRRR